MRLNRRCMTALSILILVAGPLLAAGPRASDRPSARAKSAAKAPSPEKRWGRALWRSALLPGWGQWHNGDNLKGWAFFGAFAVSGTIGLTAFFGEHTSYDGYLRAKNPAEATSAWAANRGQAQLLTVAHWGMGLAYAGSIVDAVYFAPTTWPEDPAAANAAGLRPVLLALDWEF